MIAAEGNLLKIFFQLIALRIASPLTLLPTSSYNYTIPK